MHLYETHLPVADTERARDFYTDVVGLPFAYRDPTRDIVFLWATSREQGMIGLWGSGTTYGISRRCHVAFAVSFDQLFARIKELNKHAVETFGFGGNKSEEPTVIGWMPSAQIYFHDLDGHTLEFISILPQPANPTFVGSYSQWETLCAGKA
jgi:lactoylglutathione lyase